MAFLRTSGMGGGREKQNKKLFEKNAFSWRFKQSKEMYNFPLLDF